MPNTLESNAVTECQSQLDFLTPVCIFESIFVSKDVVEYRLNNFSWVVPISAIGTATSARSSPGGRFHLENFAEDSIFCVLDLFIIVISSVDVLHESVQNDMQYLPSGEQLKPLYGIFYSAALYYSSHLLRFLGVWEEQGFEIELPGYAFVIGWG